MSADLHIHIFEGITEKDLKEFFSTAIGSKYFNPNIEKRENSYEKIGSTPNVWIGEVSWLKAALFDQPEIYVPSTVQKIADLIDENLPVLTDKFISQILDAFSLFNETSYELAKPEKVKEFLELHKGKKVFTVSW